MILIHVHFYSHSKRSSFIRYVYHHIHNIFIEYTVISITSISIRMSETLSYKKSGRSTLKTRINSPIGSSSPVSSPLSSSTPTVGTPTVPASQSRRKALKDFYKLQEIQKQQMANEISIENSTESTGAGDAAAGSAIDSIISQQQHTITEPEIELSVENFDLFIGSTNFIKLLDIATNITETLNSNQSEIKSIIYNNYYELIKINDVLLDLKEKNEQDRANGKSGVTEHLNSIKGNLNSLKEMDLNIFDDEEINFDDDASSSSSAHYNMKKRIQDQEDIEALSKSINQLILSTKLDKHRLEKIDSVLPELKGESIILQMNELKNKGFL